MLTTFLFLALVATIFIARRFHHQRQDLRANIDAIRQSRIPPPPATVVEVLELRRRLRDADITITTLERQRYSESRAQRRAVESSDSRLECIQAASDTKYRSLLARHDSARTTISSLERDLASKDLLIASLSRQKSALEQRVSVVDTATTQLKSLTGMIHLLVEVGSFQAAIAVIFVGLLEADFSVDLSELGVDRSKLDDYFSWACFKVKGLASPLLPQDVLRLRGIEYPPALSGFRSVVSRLVEPTYPPVVAAAAPPPPVFVSAPVFAAPSFVAPPPPSFAQTPQRPAISSVPPAPAPVRFAPAPGPTPVASVPPTVVKGAVLPVGAENDDGLDTPPGSPAPAPTTTTTVAATAPPPAQNRTTAAPFQASKRPGSFGVRG